MLCEACNQKISKKDKFCRHCGMDLREESDNIQIPEIGEEIVLFVAEKHRMGLFWPVILSPVFLSVFWKIYTYSHGIFGILLGFVVLAPVVYMIWKHCSDKMVITNKFAHLKFGVFEVEELDIPIENISDLAVKQTLLGNIFNYGHVSFTSAGKERVSIDYVQNYAELDYLINNPAEYIKEALTV